MGENVVGARGKALWPDGVACLGNQRVVEFDRRQAAGGQGLDMRDQSLPDGGASFAWIERGKNVDKIGVDERHAYPCGV